MTEAVLDVLTYAARVFWISCSNESVVGLLPFS